ncbi:receptor-type tyrosine-protein phosphatase eta [Anguilla rostrata]|uniref:receptor-type tyrosine-protein phosphatase eta n=1 Tax=Anguilla rostrata TaxID=7938 RepID=UPI0030CB2ACA
MRRPRSVETVSLKTLLVMLLFLKVSKEVLGCTDCKFTKEISTSEIIISGASECTVSSSAVLQNTPNGNGLNVSGLVPGRSYNLTLNCSTKCCIQFTTGPDVIRNLSVTHVTTETVSLNWTEPEGMSSFYRVEWDDSTVPVNKTTNETSVVITGLTAGVQYVFRVVAVAADNQTAGDSVSETQYTKPDVISNLSVTHVTTETVSLSWTAPQGNSSFYRVEWGESTVSMSKTTNETSVVITGLTAGAQYVFRVVAVAADNQTAGDSVSKTQYTRPEKVVKNPESCLPTPPSRRGLA